MAESPQSPRSDADERARRDRLESWKEIAAYLKRDVTTVQRWEKREGMPVHRHLHSKLGSVFAFRSDLDAWVRSRQPGGGSPEDDAARHPEASEPSVGSIDGAAATPPAAARSGRTLARWALAVAGIGLVAAAGAWQLREHRRPVGNPLADARYVQLTDFDGIEQAATLSRDGRFVAFQSDRDGPMDLWVTQVGTGQFTNLTRGGAPEFVNPSLRALGFSPDGALVTFWARDRGDVSRPGIAVWAVPLFGGPPRRYLDGAAEYDWTSDAARLVFHTPGPGDPMYVRDADPSAEARNIFKAPEGLHAHFLVWSPDRAFIYFAQGELPDRLDLWRIRPTGGSPERLTHHQSTVTHPVFLDDRTLLYLVTDADGFGPWIHTLDVEDRVSRRVSTGADGYTSLAASADGQRLVVTRASPKRTLWRVPLASGRVDMSAARRISLTTRSGSFARLGADFLLYVSPKGTGDSLWKLKGEAAVELWGEAEARIIAAPAIDREGGRVAFPVRRGGRTMLYVVNADGTGARPVTSALDLQGSPAWAPDGRAITVAAVVNGTPQLFDVPLDGGSPAPLSTGHATGPAWSPAGDLVAFTGPDVGTRFPLRVARRDGTPHPIPGLQLPRGARHLAFMPGGRSLFVLKGEIGHKNLWLLDLDTGAERQVTDLGPEFDLRDYDVSPDGRELVLEQVQEQSDLVMIERRTSR